MNPEFNPEKVAAAKLAIRAADVVAQEVEVITTTQWVEMIRCAHRSALRCLKRGCNAGSALRAGIRAARCVIL